MSEAVVVEDVIEVETAELVEELPILQSDLLVEDVSIDGMCGVY